MALQDIDGTFAFRIEAMARRAVAGLAVTRHAGLRPHAIMRGTRRPTAPSRRLPLAHMDRAAFVRLAALWIGAVVTLLAAVLALRWLV